MKCYDWRIPYCPCEKCRVFYTAKGELTRYSLACGYIQRFETSKGECTLWMEHGVFHVRQNNSDASRVFWETYNKIGEARRKYNNSMRSL
jgi:hypothetical protein